MNLFVSATSAEIQPLRNICSNSNDFLSLVCGVGCVETTLNLTKFLLDGNHPAISSVINIGAAGAFLGRDLNLLDVCIAEQETLADLGISFGERIEPFTFADCPNCTISLDRDLSKIAKKQILKKDIPVKTGNFVTVNSVSGTALRGNRLRDQHQAICENMEGFAVARVCASFSIPCLEIRCISNFVEDRDLSDWQFDAACQRLGEAAAAFICK
jgi:futalosine hydrolase